ncbi:RNA methyltransferase, partial [Escherichia coli]|nr:RNA methyltransferase [Escherichia coli]
NQNQVNTFLATNPNFRLIKDQSLLPSEGYDGFYMALIERLED